MRVIVHGTAEYDPKFKSDIDNILKIIVRKTVLYISNKAGRQPKIEPPKSA